MQCSGITYLPNQCSTLLKALPDHPAPPESPSPCQGHSALPRRRSYFPFRTASQNFHHSSWKFLLDFCLKLEKKRGETINLFSRKKIEREITYTQYRLIKINNWTLLRCIPFRQAGVPKPFICQPQMLQWWESGVQTCGFIAAPRCCGLGPDHSPKLE